MTLIEDLPASEKRRLLFVSRLRFGIESKIPRRKAVDRIVENALFILGPDGSFSARQVMEAFREVGKVPTLRVKEIEEALRRLVEEDRVREHHGKLSRSYTLRPRVAEDVRASYEESGRRLERVIKLLFGDLAASAGQRLLEAVFLEFVCEVFSMLGAQWVRYLSGEPIDRLINLEDIEALARARVGKHNLERSLSTRIQKHLVEFLARSDPDFDYLKFSLGQSFYIVHLLGVEGRNLLSEEIFSGGKLYLDSSVVIPALLGESRHYLVFQELLKVCRNLGIEVLVARPTVDEVRGVSASQEQLAPTLYNQVPEGIAPMVFGDFFQTYCSLKAYNPAATPEEMFAPFHKLADVLRSDLGIRVVDDEKFEKLADIKEFEDVKSTLQAASEDVRKREKFQNALTHDAKVFLFLRSECKSKDDKIWFVTRDSSLPKAWSLLQPHGLAVRCFLLDGLLQSISPFVVDDGGAKDLSHVFSQVVAAQLVPQGRIFDIEDFLLLQDLQIDCSDLPEDELEEALLSIKTHVLHGAAYSRDKFEEASYEMRKIFARRDKRVEKLAAERDDLEQMLRDQTAKHQNKASTMQKEIDGLKAKEARRSQALNMLLRQGIFCAILFVTLYGALVAVNRWGAGSNLLQKISSEWFLFPVVLGLDLCIGKFLLFRREKLSEVFSFWNEVKELFV